MPLNNMIQKCMGMKGRRIWEEVGCEYDRNALYKLLEEQTKVKGKNICVQKRRKGKNDRNLGKFIYRIKGPCP